MCTLVLPALAITLLAAIAAATVMTASTGLILAAIPTDAQSQSAVHVISEYVARDQSAIRIRVPHDHVSSFSGDLQQKGFAATAKMRSQSCLFIHIIFKIIYPF